MVDHWNARSRTGTRYQTIDKWCTYPTIHIMWLRYVESRTFSFNFIQNKISGSCIDCFRWILFLLQLILFFFVFLFGNTRNIYQMKDAVRTILTIVANKTKLELLLQMPMSHHPQSYHSADAPLLAMRICTMKIKFQQDLVMRTEFLRATDLSLWWWQQRRLRLIINGGW